jgi:hypothetical protein
LITVDLIGYRTKNKYHGCFRVWYIYKDNEWEVSFLDSDAEIKKEK